MTTKNDINTLYRDQEHAWYMIKELEDQLEEISNKHADLKLELRSWFEKVNTLNEQIKQIENELPEHYEIPWG